MAQISVPRQTRLVRTRGIAHSFPRLKTIVVRVLALGGALLGLAAHGAINPQRFSAQEIAQGYADSTVIARPLSEDDAAVEASEIREGLVMRQRFRRLGNMRVLRLPEGLSVDQAITRLRATGRYAYVEPDRLLRAHGTPNDPSFPLQWSLNNSGQNGGTLQADIRAVSGWDNLTSTLRSGTNQRDVIVAIVDSGIRQTHTDLTANLWTQTGTNAHGIRAVNGNGTTSADPEDDSGHGTHVAGIAGATGNNSVGISGVAWRTRLMALKFLTAAGSGSTSDSIACINYAITNGASVINASFGSDRYSTAEFEAIKSARDQGIIFVASAGNDGLLTDVNENYPGNYPLDNIVVVAATTRTDALAAYSNYGSGLVELGAPGSEIYSTYYSNNDSYSTLSGTSMAAPHVSGALALLRASFPFESYRQLINRLLRSTTKTSGLNGKVQTGGRLNLAQALASNTTGSNRPFNDGFSERAIVSGANVRIRSNNEGATADPGEPSHAGVTSNTTLWWSWTAPATSLVAFDTVGSSFDTALAVYTGSNFPLQLVLADDNANASVTTSRVLLNVTGGTTYQIAVSGKNSTFGYTSLRIGTVPSNDNFGSAKQVTGESLIERSTLLNATRESGEQDPTRNAAGHSVWYKWVSPRAGSFTLAAFATAIDTVAAVYTGSASSPSSLTLVAAQDNSAANPTNSDALVRFNATANTTYYFSIDHTTASSGSLGGEFIMTVTDSAWQFPANDEVTSSPAVGSDGTVYFGAGSDEKHDTQVYAVTAAGTKKWSFATAESGIIGATPAVGADDTVYIGSSNKIFYALNGANGVEKWRFTATTPIYSAAAISSAGHVYFRDDNTLYSLSSTGALRWSFSLAGTTSGTYSSPTIGPDGTVYVGTDGRGFYAITDNGSSATQKWKFTADGDIYTSASLASDGTIYFATLNGTVYALKDNGGSASLKWSWTTPGNSSITSSIAVATDGTLYFAAYDRKLRALTATGAEKWAFTLGDEVRASSPAIAADGTVYIGCYDSQVYAVTADGNRNRVYTTAKTIRSSPVIAGNRLYFGSADAKLYAFDLGQSAAASAWPMFRQNPARTGRGATTALSISAQPQSRTIVAGSSVTLALTTSGSGTLSYQWYKDGVALGGATAASFTISNASAADAGSYTATVTSGSESVTSSAAMISVLPSGTLPASFANIATRAYCSTENKVTIGGFVVTGTVPKRVLVRAVGPTLTTQGIGPAEVLADPTITVYRGSTVLANNDNWGDNANAAEITAAGQQIGAGPLAADDSKSSALLLTLDPGVYSFIVNGKGGASGIVLLEVYDADGGINSKFVNIATRAYCTTGNGVAIGGFVISGSVSKNVYIRAVGPTLLTQGISAGEVLTDPTIDLYRGAGIVATNDNWTEATNSGDMPGTGARIGATPFSATDTNSSALLLNLQPGVYSFIARRKSNASGIVLVEIYDAD